MNLNYLRTFVVCPKCGTEDENIKIEYFKSFDDEYDEEYEFLDCKCFRCGFVFQESI